MQLHVFHTNIVHKPFAYQDNAVEVMLDRISKCRKKIKSKETKRMLGVLKSLLLTEVGALAWLPHMLELSAPQS
jgi:hypothetical protein